MIKHAHGVLVGLWMVFCAHPLMGQSVVADSVLLNKGIEAFDQGAYEEAIVSFRQLLEQDSLHAEAHARLARTYKILGRHIRAANQARLAVRDEPDNIEYLILRYQIGFIQPSAIDLARKRGLLKRILDLDPGNAFANTEAGREKALVYIHNKDRIRIPDFEPQPSPLGAGAPNVRRNIALDNPTRVRDPFDLSEMRAQGYTIIDESRRADEAYGEALAHLVRAAQTDPAYRPLYDPLMAILALNGQHRDMYRLAGELKKSIPGDPYGYLYAGYAAYKLGNLFLAEQNFERGRMLLSPEDSAAFNDLSRIMNKKQVKEGQADISRVAYWAGKDPRQLTPMNERKIEHDARLVFASLLFGEPKLDMRGWDAERGEIYVRYGEPQRMYYATIAVEDCNISGNTAQSTLKSGIGNITNFQVFDYGGYRFVFGQAGNFGGSEDANEVGNARVPSLNEYPLYSTCSSANANDWNLGADLDYVTRSEEVIRETPNEYRLPGNVVAFPHLATRFKGAPNRADVVVMYGFPISTSNQPESNELFMLGLEVGAFLTNERGEQSVSSRRTIGSVYPGEMQHYEEATLWPGAHRLEVAPGTYSLSVEFERRADAALGASQEEITIPDFHSNTFQMSDIMLAYFVEDAVEREYSDGIITRKGLDIQAAPWGVYENGKPVYFYFELYNMSASVESPATYSIEAILIDEKSARSGRNRLFRRFRRNQDTGVAVSFDGSSNTSDTEQYLILDTEGLDPGNYVLIVRVTDAVSEIQVEQERTIYVR